MYIPKHDTIDKFFNVTIGSDLCLEVDYDDVDHKGVDAEITHLSEIIEKHWDKKRVEEIKNQMP